MDDKTFRLIAASEVAKEVWDTLQKILEGLRYKNPKKEESDMNLKRARFEILSEEDHEDQERIIHLKALSIIVKTKGGTLQKIERFVQKIERFVQKTEQFVVDSSDCQVRLD